MHELVPFKNSPFFSTTVYMSNTRKQKSVKILEIWSDLTSKMYYTF